MLGDPRFGVLSRNTKRGPLIRTRISCRIDIFGGFEMVQIARREAFAEAY